MFVYIPLTVKNIIVQDFFGKIMEIFKIVANILLIQSWFLDDVSINGASWYLSCMSAICLVTPLLLFLNSKIRKRR